MPAQFSVVIPAHNEERLVARCLAFVHDLADGEAEVVVAANGCTDETVAAARTVAGVTVLDLPAPGKIGALNAGDAACSAFPRIYLDADILVQAETLRRLADRLSGPEALVASPRVVFDTTARPWGVRAFYDMYRALPYVRDGLIGLGVYAVSEAGRARWQAFPDVTADDLFVQRLFADDERVVMADCSFEVQTPHSLGDLLRVRTRTVFGSNELAARRADDAAFATTSGDTKRALVNEVRRHPSLLPAAVVYAGVMVEARRRARGSGGGEWHRDDSTR